MRRYHNLFVCLLLIGQINQIFAQQEPSLNPQQWALTMQAKLEKVQQAYSSVAEALRNAGNTNLVPIDSSVIDNDLEVLKRELDNFVHNPTGQHESAALQDVENIDDPVISDVIADIRNRRFPVAEEKLQQITNLEEISKIIHVIYESNSNNFDLLADFIESLSEINLIYVSVDALLRNLEENEHTDPFKCIRLAKILETRFINNQEIDYFLLQFRHVTYNKLKEIIKSFMLQALNAALSQDLSATKDELSKLTAAVYHFDPLHWERIVYVFLNSNIDKISKVLQIITNLSLMEEMVTGINTIYWSLQFRHEPKSNVIIEIASILKELRSDIQFQSLNDSIKDLGNEIIEDLPICAKNLFFLPSGGACLWNEAAEAYLTAVNTTSKYSTMRRQIFSTHPMPGSQWYFNKIDNYFLISSVPYKDELLFAVNSKHNSNLRHVYGKTSKSRKKAEERSKWIIELENDICYVKSAKFKEYLMTSNFYSGNNFRHVFTWIPRTIFGEPQFRWQVRNCS